MDRNRGSLLHKPVLLYGVGAMGIWVRERMNSAGEPSYGAYAIARDGSSLLRLITVESGILLLVADHVTRCAHSSLLAFICLVGGKASRWGS